MHYAMAWGFERVMNVPLLSLAQLRILAEGVVTPLPFADPPPPDLRPATPFDQRSIRAGLPEPARFRRSDLRCYGAGALA